MEQTTWIAIYVIVSYLAGSAVVCWWVACELASGHRQDPDDKIMWGIALLTSPLWVGTAAACLAAYVVGELCVMTVKAAARAVGGAFAAVVEAAVTRHQNTGL